MQQPNEVSERDQLESFVGQGEDWFEKALKDHSSDESRTRGARRGYFSEYRVAAYATIADEKRKFLDIQRNHKLRDPTLPLVNAENYAFSKEVMVEKIGKDQADKWAKQKEAYTHFMRLHEERRDHDDKNVAYKSFRAQLHHHAVRQMDAFMSALIPEWESQEEIRNSAAVARRQNIELDRILGERTMMMTEMRRANANLKRDKAELDTKNKKLEEGKAENEKELAMMKSEKHQVDMELSDLESIVEDLKAERQVFAGENEKLKREKAELESEETRLQLENQQLDKSVKSLHNHICIMTRSDAEAIIAEAEKEGPNLFG